MTGGKNKIVVMDEVPGSVGTSAGLALRLRQAVFSSASLLFMSLGVQFYTYTSLWYQSKPACDLGMADITRTIQECKKLEVKIHDLTEQMRQMAASHAAELSEIKQPTVANLAS